MAELQALAAGQERLSYKLEVADRSLPRLLRTVAHLRPGQVAQRLRLSSRRALWSRMGTRVDARYRARAARLPPLPFDHAGLARVASLRCGRSGSEEALAVAGDARAGRFTFLDVTREFGAEVDWYRPDLDEGTRLWKTLLHEFPYALDLARAHVESGDPGFRRALLALVRGWADASPIGRPGFALDAWNARAVSHRLVHWAVAGSLLELAADDPDAAFLGNAIALQAVFLRDNLEWDLRGNHLLSDLVALVLAHQLLGCAPEALALLQRQIEEQVLADGCHVERVPLYHALALRDLCETRAVLGEAAPAWLEDAIARMAGYLEWLLPADGRLPLFGDSWHGEVDSRRTLEEASARRIAPDVATAAAASGLLALRRGEAHAVVRAGAHGPDWQLGHAHADALSFELSLGRDRVVTDTGTPTYDAGARRARALSTAAHNTLQIDGEEQIECWGSFRVGRRGRAGVRAAGATADWQWLWASYDGWRWLSGRPSTTGCWRSRRRRWWSSTW